MASVKRGFALGVATLLAVAGLSVGASAASVPPAGSGPSAAAQRVFDFWTPERIASAIPRDLTIDPRGLAYLVRPGGVLEPYGHSTPARGALPVAGTSTNTTVSNPSPSDASPIAGPTGTFSATVVEPDSVKTVTFSFQPSSGGTVSSVSATRASGTLTNGVWTASFTFPTSGAWSWWVVVKDAGPKGGATFTSTTWSVTVGTGSGTTTTTGTPSTKIGDASWAFGGQVQNAAGRILFAMADGLYVCSGTAVTDTVSGVSLVFTAAHCVYDDLNKEFALNAMFIPNQAGTTGTRTDSDCSNDPLGCWAMNYGVVHAGWSSRTWPDNQAWDYGWYAVATSGQHTAGINPASDSLESAVNPLTISFSTPSSSTTYALGYSYAKDPSFRYCSDTLSNISTANWYLASCKLTGGASGGPWMQSATGAGPIISVNSWVPFAGPGMAGPKLSGTSKASCTYTGTANTTKSLSPAARGYESNCN